MHSRGLYVITFAMTPSCLYNSVTAYVVAQKLFQPFEHHEISWRKQAQRCHNHEQVPPAGPCLDSSHSLNFPSLCTYMSVCKCMYIHVYIYICIYTCICTYGHTQRGATLLGEPAPCPRCPGTRSLQPGRSWGQRCEDSGPPRVDIEIL